MCIAGEVTAELVSPVTLVITDMIIGTLVGCILGTLQLNISAQSDYSTCV
jgi:hypothetical protein